MNELAQLRAAQHDDLLLPSDHAFAAFLAETPIEVALLDMLPHTDRELLHLMRAAA